MFFTAEVRNGRVVFETHAVIALHDFLAQQWKDAEEKGEATPGDREAATQALRDLRDARRDAEKFGPVIVHRFCGGRLRSIDHLT